MYEFQEKVKQSKQQVSSTKGFLIALILFVILAASANPLSSWLAESGFNEQKADRVYLAAAIKRNLLSYEVAGDLYTRIIETFPQEKEAALYYLAFCLERKGEKQDAIKAYSDYLNLFPSGEFSQKAQDKLKGLMSLK